MEAKHTPGPWKASNWTCHAATTIKAGDIVVAECSGFGRLASESLADARLIAAAPELLEALSALLHKVDIPQQGMGLSADIYRARAAIAKATGQATLVEA